MILLYNFLNRMCKQFANIFSIMLDAIRHYRFSTFRAIAQGGDRYSKFSAHEFYHVLPQNIGGSKRLGQTGIRCTRIFRYATNQGSQMSAEPKNTAFGCGHQNSKRKKQRTGLIVSLSSASIYAFPLKYRSQLARLMVLSPFSQYRRLVKGIPYFRAKGLSPNLRDFR